MIFWQKLPKPFFVLAPMANVTDSVFRTLFAKYGKPDVTWTEFVSADGLCSPAGKKMLLRDLAYTSAERPIVAQLFTGHPEAMLGAAKLVAKLGFDGLDINMGCPDKSVEKQGGGAAAIRDPKVALAVLGAAREGWLMGIAKAGQNGHFEPLEEPHKNDMYRNCETFSIDDKNMANSRASVAKDSQLEYLMKKNMPPESSHMANTANIPVSIKTRIGYNSVDLNWLRLLLEQKLPALTVHLRTRKEMSDVPAHWEIMPEIVKMRDEISPETLIIGNGDVTTMDEAVEKTKKYGCDGVMIGRGIFGKPWFFGDINKERVKEGKSEKTPTERLTIMLEHAKLFDKTFCKKTGIGAKTNHKNFSVMKKHFKAYVSGWDGAKELRVELMEVNTYKEVEKIVKTYLNTK